MRRSIAALEPVIAAGAGPTFVFNLVEAHVHVGEQLSRMGKDSDAAEEFRRSQSIAEKCASAFPADAAAIDWLANATRHLVDSLAATGDLRGALQRAGQAVRRVEQAKGVATDASASWNLRRRRHISVSPGRIGRWSSGRRRAHRGGGIGPSCQRRGGTDRARFSTR